MFSGTPPPPARRSASSRRAGTSRSVPASGQTTPRRSLPPSGSTPNVPLTARTLGHNLQATSRALTASTAPPSNANSRRRNKPAGSVGPASEAGTAMDDGALAARSQDEVVERILVRDESYYILERKGLPAEVEEVVQSADPYTDPFRASLDTLTGFAYLISREYCFVWNWSRRFSSSTTYIFPLPRSLSLSAAVSAFSPLSFATFVPTSSHQAQREPGLLIISPTGDVRFWENISMALSGVDRWKGADLSLAEGELVRGVQILSPTSYLVSTSQARILVVSISSIGGKVELGARAFDRTIGWAGSVWSAVFGAKVADPRAGLLALALSEPTNEGERFAYAVTEKNVQVWRLPARDDGGERLAIEQDMFAGVLEAIKGEKVGNEEWAINEGKVEVLDVVVGSDGILAVLVSHVTEQTARNSLSYAIVRLEIGTTQNSVVAHGVRHLAFQAPPDPRPLSTPKLSLPGGDAAFVVFVDAVVVLSLSPNSNFEESFPLRSNTNRFLGISSPSSSSYSGTPSLTLLTASASLLSIEISSDGLFMDENVAEGFYTRKLKTKIEQAIFFGAADADNPLAFDLLPDFQGDLMVASGGVSSEILSSDSANMPSILDLRAQIADRISRARALIQYINSNGLLGKLSQSLRRQLSNDAERLAAAAVLWHHQNARLGDSESLLSEAVQTFMNEIGEGFGEDPLRNFYRTKVASIGTILDQITKLAKNLLASTATAAARSTALHESNYVLLLVMNAVARHRRETATLYGIDTSLLPSEPWTGYPSRLEGLQWHFDATDGLLRDRTRELGPALDEQTVGKFGGRPRGIAADVSDQQAMQGELKKQMTSLADYVFSSYEERLLFLSTTNLDGSTSAESRVLTERYQALRPRFIRTLVSIDKVTHAYELAERHQDFRSLVELCNDAQHGSIPRTQFFLQKYAQRFAFPLYEFLLEKGQLRALLEQDDVYRSLLTEFLDSNDNPRISWINDIAIGRYATATECLFRESTREADVAQKKLMLSLAKLAQIAQVSKQTIDTEEVQRAIENVDDNLDLVNSQQGLVDLFLSNLSGTETRLPVEEQAEIIASRLAPSLEDRPAFAQLFTKLTVNLLQARTLSPEDLIDILTLKENTGEQAGDFAAALQVLVRAKTMPEARKEVALQSIWRRCYARDNWEVLRSASNLRDQELANVLRNTALFATVSAATRADQPPSVYLDPSRSIFTGTAEELSARFSEAPAHLVDLLLNDFEKESNDVLTALRQFGLDEYCSEIMRLLNEGGHGEDEGEEDGVLVEGDDSLME